MHIFMDLIYAALTINIDILLMINGFNHYNLQKL